MKKWPIFLAFIILIFFISCSSFASMNLFYDGKAHSYTAKPVSLIINGEKIEPTMPPVILSGQTLVPARAIFEKMGAEVKWSPKTQIAVITSDTSTITLKINNKLVDVDGQKFEVDVPPKIINNSTMIPLRFVSQKLGLEVKWDGVTRIIDIKKEESNEQVILKNINVSRSAGNTTVELSGQGKFLQYSKMELHSPERVVVDISDAILDVSNNKMIVGDGVIDSIRTSQYKVSPNVTRVVIDLIQKTDYSITTSTDKRNILIAFSSKQTENVVYGKAAYSYDGINAKISIDNPDLYSKISVKDEIQSDKRITLTYPLDYIDLGFGTMDVNDSMVKSIELSSPSSDTGQMIINFNFNGNVYYNIFKDDNGKTIVNISTSIPVVRRDGRYLIVIDAGHGGKDPGAVYTENYTVKVAEKDLNLDIAMRLNSLFKDSKVDTIMTRDKDVFVELRERANIANRANADLFISIHNNFMPAASYKGTMTLYFPNQDNIKWISDKNLAEIIQSELLSILKTENKKIVPRPNLVVLNSTNMPAALAEIGFISNESERKNLSNPEFRQKAAQGLYNAIMKALSILKIN
jgi:N-acetylmuramoyl-L-alanine amidase